MIDDVKPSHFAAALEIAPPLSFTAAVVTRFAFEEFRETITSTSGARQYGGRWNPIGIGALYTAIQRETALAEFTQNVEAQEPSPPTVMVSLIINAAAVADFTNPAFRVALGVELADLVRTRGEMDYRTPQYLGALAYGHPIDAVLVPSAAKPGGTNLVLFGRGYNDPPLVVVGVR